MSLFDSLGGQQQLQNPQQLLAELKAHPAAMLQRFGFTLPDGISDPQQIIQHLMQSGQITQSRVNQIMRQMPRR